MTASAAIARLRFGPGLTCEQVARVIERVTARAERGGVEPDRLIVVGGRATAAEDIVRVRRKFHGKADWIASPAADIVVELQPVGLQLSAQATNIPAPTPAPTPAPAPPSAAVSAPPSSALPAPSSDVLGDAIRERLLEVIDPDLGINIVDLGFYRRLRVEDEIAIITMTLTSAACPVTGVMEDQIRTELAAEPPLWRDFRIEWEWIPSWCPADITLDGREQLQAIGFTI